MKLTVAFHVQSVTVYSNMDVVTLIPSERSEGQGNVTLAVTDDKTRGKFRFGVTYTLEVTEASA